MIHGSGEASTARHYSACIIVYAVTYKTYNKHLSDTMYGEKELPMPLPEESAALLEQSGRDALVCE